MMGQYDYLLTDRQNCFQILKENVSSTPKDKATSGFYQSSCKFQADTELVTERLGLVLKGKTNTG